MEAVSSSDCTTTPPPPTVLGKNPSRTCSVCGGIYRADLGRTAAIPDSRTGRQHPGSECGEFRAGKHLNPAALLRRRKAQKAR